MEKTKIKSFFGGMEDVWLNNIRLSPSNINDFKLFLIYSDDKVDFYSTRKKKNRLFISHWKEMKIVSWFGTIEDSYKEAEERLQEAIEKTIKNHKL